MQLPRYALIVSASALFGCRATSVTTQPAPPQPYRLVNELPALWRLMDATARQDDATWLAAYRVQIIGAQPHVYALARSGLDDSSLVRFRRALLRNEGEYRAISDSLPSKLSAQWTRFVRALPDTKPGAVIYVLPAPPSALGGWVRPFADHDAVVLGLDFLANVRSDAEFGVRVSHELAHLYHAQANPQMRSVMATFFMGRGQHATALHELMWIEGFAVHASRQLTPGAEQNDVMNTRVMAANDAARARSARAFRERLDTTDRATIEAFVYGGAEAVPPQAVNYLGLLVGERLGARYTLSELARLHGTELRDAIQRELEAVETVIKSP